MKHCKRLLILLFALLLAISMVACGDDEEGEPTGTSSSESTSDTSNSSESSSSTTQNGGGEPAPADPMVFTLMPGGTAYSFTEYNGTDTQVTIPATWEGKPVAAIGALAFEGCTAITSVAIPESVTSIGAGAFKGCTELTAITIPKNVTEIGAKILENCTKLTTVTFDAANYPDGDATTQSFLGIGAQNVSLVIGTNVKRVAAFTFYNAPFKTITFQPGVCNTIAANAFKGCSGVTSLVIPDSVLSIGAGAFNGCSGLTSIDLPFLGANKNVETTGAPDAMFGYVFGTAEASGCTPIRQRYGSALLDVTTYYIPTDLATVTIRGGDIGYNGFERCAMVESLTLGDGVTSVADNALDGTSWYINSTADFLYAGKFLYATGEGAQSLTSIVLPEGTKGICGYALLNCNLQTLTIPASLTSISPDAFICCYELTSFTVDANNPAFQAIDGVLFDKAGTTLVRYPSGRTDTSYEIPENVIFVESMAFAYNDYLTSITVPASVAAIRVGAFRNMIVLEEIVVDGENSSLVSVDGILYNAEMTELLCFPSKAAIKHFTVPASVTSIAQYAFVYSRLETVTIGTQVHTIAEEAFNCCEFMIIYASAVVAPQGWAEGWSDTVVYFSVKDGNLINVNDMQILVSEKTGGGYTAQITKYVGNAQSIVIPASVQFTPVGGSAVTVPVERIGKHAFAYATIESFDFTQNPTLKDFGNGVFFNSAFWMAQPDGVVYLNNMAIGYKGELPESGIVTIADGTTAICYKAFYEVDELTAIVLPSSVTYIGENAFASPVFGRVITILTYHTPETQAEIEVATNNPGYTSATICYYSETAPTTEGYFWHMVESVPTLWPAHQAPAA